MEEDHSNIAVEKVLAEKPQITQAEGIKQQIKMENIQFIEEGYAKIQKSFRETTQQGKQTESEVFYNPVQVFNRDITVLVIHMFTEYLKAKGGDKFKGITILDALSASGLRTIRFSKELKNIKKVYANDISQASHKLMMDNFKLNNLDLSKIEMTLKDAVQLLYEHKFMIAAGDYEQKFDVIDLDPYGTAAPFLDAAIQSSNGETLLCVTSTDSRILCGPDTQKCFYLYGSSRAKIAAFQENSVRIILNTVNSIANRYGKSIKPLISYQSEFYVRVFLIVAPGKSDCAKSLVRVGNVFHCDTCQNQYYQSFGKEKKAKNTEQAKFVPAKMSLPSTQCNQCGDTLTINGPIWVGKMNDAEFVQKTVDYLNSDQFDLPLVTKKKIQGILHSIQQEQQFEVDDVPLGHHFEHICKMMKTTVPNKRKIQSAFVSLGYKIEQTYLNPTIFKTDAPSEIVYDVIRNWKRLQQPNEEDYLKAFEVGSPGYKMVNQPAICQPNWDMEVSHDSATTATRMARWIPNPEKNWGPGRRAVVNRLIEENEPAKSSEKINEEESDNGEKVIKKNKQE